MSRYERFSGRSATPKSPEERRGLIQGDYPIYLPDDALFSKRLVLRTQLQTLHEGVSLTMAKIREKYWISPLRRLTKRVINECPG